MKRLVLLLALVCLGSASVHAQQQRTANLTTQATSCASPPKAPQGTTGYIWMPIPQNAGSATIDLEGTWSGTVSFFSSANGASNWQPITSVQNSISTTTQYSSYTGNGTFQFSIGSYSHLCAAFTTASSGSVVTTLAWGIPSARAGGGGGGGSGTVSGQANGVIPLGTTATSITQQSHMDDGVTTAATITSSEPLVASSVQAGSTACTPAGSGATGGVCAPESASTGWSATAGFDYMRADSTAHNFVVSVNGGSETPLPQKICSHVALTMRTSLISSATTDTAVTGTCTGLTASDTVSCTFAANPTSSTGFTASTSGILTIFTWPTSNTINAAYQNNTSGSITPAAQTLNCNAWR